MHISRQGVRILHNMVLGIIYTELKLGIEKITKILKPFDIEFQPFIDEINAKEGAIRRCADAATMERIKSKISAYTFDTVE